MKHKFSLIIDFDSTIISIETLEYLASISLEKNNHKNKIINQISKYTNLAMNGEITFEKSLDIRLNLMGITRNHINKAIDGLSDKLDDTFLDNIDFFKENINDIYIVSGGFKSIISPILLSFMNLDWNIFANEFKFDKDDNVVGIESNNPLAFSKGKVELVKKLNLNNDVIIIGDGYTDYEVKKYGAAKHFLAYTAHVKRDNVIVHADKVCKNFNQVLEFIKKIN
tara:strand:+ start:508 stop:1182 length:675 start_codon:yes stop_codon:yes gene_type:complete